MTGPSNSTQLAESLHDKALAPNATGPSVRQIIEKNKAEFAKALPKAVDPERFMRLITTEFRVNPKLYECTVESLMSSVMASAQLGLEPGPLQHAYLIPRYSKKRRAMECTFLIGYQGLIELFRRAGVSVFARKVCELDKWEFWTDEKGDHLEHRPALNERGKPICYYGLATLPGGTRIVHVMSISDIDKHRSRSEMPDAGPWRDDREAMSCKTVIRDMARWIPKSIVMDALSTERVFDQAPDLIVSPNSVQPVEEWPEAELVKGDQPAIDAASDDGWEPEPEGDVTEKESLP